MARPTLAYAVHIDGILTDLIKPCPHREHVQVLASEAVSVATGGEDTRAISGRHNPNSSTGTVSKQEAS